MLTAVSGMGVRPLVPGLVYRRTAIASARDGHRRATDVVRGDLLRAGRDGWRAPTEAGSGLHDDRWGKEPQAGRRGGRGRASGPYRSSIAGPGGALLTVQTSPSSTTWSPVSERCLSSDS